MRVWAISFALVACKTRAEPPPAQVAPSAPAPPTLSAPLRPPSPSATVSSPTDAAPGTASFVVKHHFGSDLGFFFTRDGKKVEGTFHAPTGKTTTFAIPSGKLVQKSIEKAPTKNH